MVKISYSMQGDTAVVISFDRKAKNAFSFVRAAINALRLKDEALVKKKLTNDVLHVRTGALRRSIFSKISDDGSSKVTGTIGSSGDVKYAGIHEFGGVIHHPGGTAYMMVDGAPRFVRNATAASNPRHVLGRTRAHNITMPERSFLRSALREMEPEINRKLNEAVARANQS